MEALYQFYSSCSPTELIIFLFTASLCIFAAKQFVGGGVPTVGGWFPYFGCWYSFFKDPTKFLVAVRKKHGNIVKLYMGGTTYTYVFDQAFLPTFYKTPEDRLSFNKPFRVSGTRLIVDPNGQQEASSKMPKEQREKMIFAVMGVIRRSLVPKLSSFAPLFQPEIDEYVKEMFRGDTGVVSSRETYVQLVGRMSARVLVGPELCREKVLINAEIGLAELMQEVTHTLSIFWGPIKAKSKRLHKAIDALLMKAVAERRKLQAEDPENWMKTHQKDDLLSAYVKAFPYKDGMNEKQKQQYDQICLVSKSFLFAAMVNTTQGTQYTLLRILADPELKAAVVKEIDEVLREGGGDLQEDSVKKLQLIDSCFLEHTRIASGWRQMREVVKEPFKINDDVTIPVGEIICVSPWIASHSERNFKNPESFDPYRMMDGVPGGSEYRFLPFSAGKHKCLGMPMAQMEAQLTIAGLLKNYDLEIIPGKDGLLLPEPDYPKGTLALPKRDVMLKYTKREIPLGRVGVN